MPVSLWKEMVEQLRGAEYQFGVITPSTGRHRIAFEEGLTDSEIAGIEGRYKFRFPPDLREFLKTALPVGERFPNWRTGNPATLQEWLETPRQGVLFDVERNGVWLDQWGPRPQSDLEALRRVSRLIDRAPCLIPIFGHRMIPDAPHQSGNPVYSVHQTDLIYYGFDLADYLRHEFGLPGREPWPEHMRHIRFWDFSDLPDDVAIHDGIGFEAQR